MVSNQPHLGGAFSLHRHLRKVPGTEGKTMLKLMYQGSANVFLNFDITDHPKMVSNMEWKTKKSVLITTFEYIRSIFELRQLHLFD
jgi:hypothetical protein